MSKDKVNERINNSVGNQKKNKSSLKLISFVLIIVILILVGVIVSLLTEKKSKPNNIVTPDNVDQIIDQLEEEERTPVGAYEVSMNTNWEFESGDAISSNAFVENGVSNLNTVFFTISLKGSDEIIYTSPYLEVGSSLRDIQLDSKLTKGNYDAIITYHLVDEEYEELSSVSLYMQIIIKQ